MRKNAHHLWHVFWKLTEAKCWSNPVHFSLLLLLQLIFVSIFRPLQRMSSGSFFGNGSLPDDDKCALYNKNKSSENYLHLQVNFECNKTFCLYFGMVQCSFSDVGIILSRCLIWKQQMSKWVVIRNLMNLMLRKSTIVVYSKYCQTRSTRYVHTWLLPPSTWVTSCYSQNTDLHSIDFWRGSTTGRKAAMGEVGLWKECFALASLYSCNCL